MLNSQLLRKTGSKSDGSHHGPATRSCSAERLSPQSGRGGSAEMGSRGLRACHDHGCVGRDTGGSSLVGSLKPPARARAFLQSLGSRDSTLAGLASVSRTICGRLLGSGGRGGRRNNHDCGRAARIYDEEGGTATAAAGATALATAVHGA